MLPKQKQKQLQTGHQLPSIETETKIKHKSFMCIKSIPMNQIPQAQITSNARNVNEEKRQQKNAKAIEKRDVKTK